MPTKPAKYDGKCKAPCCLHGGKIKRGQMVYWALGGYIAHTDCHQESNQ